MPESLKLFESSLKEYLINVHADAHNTAASNLFKYNNLKVWMEPKRFKIPHFWVSFNISAACFQINPVEVISGGMGAEERYVRLWANRPNINAELQKTWAIEAKNNSFTILDAKDMGKKKEHRK
ncbi:hypothetical protein J6P92_08435 [bacterium]|nr:hypothetical protein [bacterium]